MASPVLTTGHQINTIPRSHLQSTVTTKTSNQSFSKPQNYSTIQQKTVPRKYSTAEPIKSGNSSTEGPTKNENIPTEKRIIPSLPHGKQTLCSDEFQDFT